MASRNLKTCMAETRIVPIPRLENPESLLIPAIKWGSLNVLFTPAYWAEVASRHSDTVESGQSFRLGSTFKEECVACLLGGYGIPGDVGNAAFKVIVASGLVTSKRTSPQEVRDVLKSPLALPDGRTVRYRFVNNKSAYVAYLLNSDPKPPPHLSGQGVRDWLTHFPGIGLKTASWIVRNWYASDEVAIIDVHLHRAGLLAGFFEPANSLPRDYRTMERRFLAFAAAIGIRPSLLDAVIWLHMRQAGRLAARCIRCYDTVC
jgi:thermostable 8-oxoguanine DNA glycosylase